MVGRIKNLHIGDLVRIYTYAGTSVETHSSHMHTVREDRFIDKVFSELSDEDGLRFLGVYVGDNDLANTHRAYENSTPEPYLLLQVLSQNFGRGHPSNIDKNTPDLRIPERLVRRVERLEPSYSSGPLPLEEMASAESLVQ